MKYIEVTATRPAHERDNREYGTIYFGISATEAIQRYEQEFPKYFKGGWIVTATPKDDDASNEKMSKAISVPGSVVTRETAAGYLARTYKRFAVDRELTQEANAVIHDIETRIADAGLMTWPEIEAVELRCVRGEAVQ